MDTVFLVISKLIGTLLRPDMWIVIALASVVLALIKQRQQLALWVGGLTLFGLVTLGILPLGNVLLQPIERTYPTNPPLSQINGIIVLGGGENVRASNYWGQMQLNEGGDRYAASVALAQRFSDAQLLFTGGSGALRDFTGAAVSEASVAESFFLSQGIDRDRLLFEGLSRNTAENARLSLALANPTPDETWVLVTSAFHMPRAIRSFELAGWGDLVPWPVDYRTSKFTDDIGWDLMRNLEVLNMVIREQVAQLSYRLTGR